MSNDWHQLQSLALREIEATLMQLPKPLREQAEKVPVIFERAPSPGLQADGIEVDTLGLFAGSEFADGGESILPAQIILFLENLWSFADSVERTYRKEVRTTYLHELGHFLGLDENELKDRGLE